MFAQNSSLKKVDARPSQIITLLVSTNRPLVALSGPAQQADAFIISVDRGKTQPVYLCFHVINGGERLIYTSNTVPTSRASRARLEEEALRFAEDMGFMMVREQFDGLSEAQRDEAMLGLAPFAEDVAAIGHDRKWREKRKKDAETKKAEPEMEYEEVYEEVEEEVPVEEEPPKPEEYESLSDVVTEVSSQEAPASASEPPRESENPEAVPRVAEAVGASEGAFDLGEELSDVVATIKEIRTKPQPTQPTAAERAVSAKPVAGRSGGRPAAAVGASAGSVSDRRDAIIRLLISL
jgi:hypothetical protein